MFCLTQICQLTRPLSQGGNLFPSGINIQVQPIYAGLAIAVLGGIALSRLSSRSKTDDGEAPGLVQSFFLFFYSSFLKPHQGDSKTNQQDALESFYKKQAGAYDSTRKVLLRGREDMLGLVVAQLKSKAEQATAAGKNQNKRIWVDVSATMLARKKKSPPYSVTLRKRIYTDWWRHRVEH